MNKFEVKDIDKGNVVTYSHWFCETNQYYKYHFYKTTVGEITIISDNDYTTHLHPLMVLLEMSYDKSDIFWRNDSKTKKILIICVRQC